MIHCNNTEAVKQLFSVPVNTVCYRYTSHTGGKKAAYFGVTKKWSLVLYHAGILLFPQLFCGHVDHCSNGMLQQNNSTFVLVPRTEPAADCTNPTMTYCSSKESDYGQRSF